MALVYTPGQFTRRAELYQQLNQLTAAGVGIVRSLQQIERNPPSRSYRKPLQATIAAINEGQNLSSAMQSAGDWLPPLDLALLQAAEHSGRLDACFRQLSGYYYDRARMAKKMIGQMVYPVGLIHFAAFVFLVVLPYAGSSFRASLGMLFLRAGLILSPLYVGTFLIIYAMQGKHGEGWRAIIEAVLHPIPLLGKARQYLALSRLATALEALISAGVNVIEAWELAANACGSPALRRQVLAWKPDLVAGRLPSEAVSRSSRFPEMFANLYASGEVSGKLDESLRQLHTYYQEEGTNKLQWIADVLPKAIYLIVAIVIAYFIISFYTGYFSQIQQIGGF